jgi:dTDP-4-amino-4,6-dideoxygalactose transaminase
MADSSPSPPEADPAGASSIALVDLRAQRMRIKDRLDRAIARVLEHGQFIMGPEVVELEGKLAAFCGARNAIACASGTDALLIAMMAKGVGRGDAVLCPGFTYPATAETIALLGATPVFVDVCAHTYNIDPAAIAQGVAAAKSKSLRPVAVIAVDLFGQPADYDAIRAAARQHGLWVLADAAQSFGATYNGRPAGTLGDITATSFFPAKPLGCYGDGGAIFTDDDALAEAMRSITLHGRGNSKYDIVRIGVNARLDTLQAAILIEKLKIFPQEIEARAAAAQRYGRQLRGVKTPRLTAGATSVWAQYTVTIDNGRRDAVASHLGALGIQTGIYYPRPLHHQRAYRQHLIAGGRLPASEFLAASVLSLPLHAYLDEADQDRVCAALHAALGAA